MERDNRPNETGIDPSVLLVIENQWRRGDQLQHLCNQYEADRDSVAAHLLTKGYEAVEDRWSTRVCGAPPLEPVPIHPTVLQSIEANWRKGEPLDRLCTQYSVERSTVNEHLLTKGYKATDDRWSTRHCGRPEEEANIVKKYEILTNDPKPAVSQPAYRIRALRDIPEHKVKAGDLGGYVQGEHNLSHEGGAWIANEAMVVDRSRVTGNAIARDHAIISGHSIIDEEAVVGGFSNTKDHVVVRGNSRVRGVTTLEDTVLVEGDVDIRQTAVLTGDDEYRNQSQVPWSFQGAFESDPEFLPRLREAAEIDPAFQRVFAALGANDADARAAAISELWADNPDGRKAIMEIAGSVGGTFTSEEYLPRSAAELAADRGTKIMYQTLSDNITGYRYLASLNTAEGYEQHSGDRLYSGVVQVELTDVVSQQRVVHYQPALYQESDPQTPTLTPLPGRTFIGDEVYLSRLDADARASEYLEAAITPEEFRSLPAPKEPVYGMRLNENHDDVPFISATSTKTYDASEPTRFKDILTVTIQKAAPSTSSLAHDLGKMSEPQGFAVLELRSQPDTRLDLSEVTKQADIKYHVTPEKARLMGEPVYSGRQEFIDRISMALDKREARVAELHQLFGVAETATAPTDAEIWDRYNELMTLEPMNKPVLHSVIDAPAVVPSPAQGPTTRDELHDQIRGQLKELDWRNMPNYFGSVGVGSHFDDAFEAQSFNVKFSIENVADPDEPEEWSLYVTKADAKPNSWDWTHPIHREDGFESDEAAMEAAEFYRAEMIVDEMKPPSPSPTNENELTSPDADRKVAAVFSEKTSQGTKYRSAAITINDAGFSASMSVERFATVTEASQNAVEQLHRELRYGQEQKIDHAAQGHLAVPQAAGLTGSM